MVRVMSKIRVCALCLILVLAFYGCGGGSSGGDSSSANGSDTANFGCDGSCARQHLTTSDVSQILSNFLLGSAALNVKATIAVVDRVGNVLALYAIPGANPTTTVNGQIGASGGLEGSSFAAAFAAISKAGTGAFLSSQGNSFSSRTASQIVQENFDPGETDQISGPLFGVQFSQLICSDINGRGQGPHALPLGLSADPGGIPLYKNGDLVGGVGIEFDGLYSLDRDIQDKDNSAEERLALYASLGFETPSERSADNIFVGGRSLRFTDLNYSDLDPVAEISVAADPAGFINLPGFFSGKIREGAQYGTAGSGILDTTRLSIPATILVDGAGNPRFPTRAGSALGSEEVDALLDSALTTAFRARAAIRTPRDTHAHVSIFVVDTDGAVLGMVRTQDAPVFGIDVSLQKARTAAFFSSSDAGAKLSAAGLGRYVSASSAFLGRDVLNGSVAMTTRSVGDLARPFFTDGIEGNPNGPFSLPFPGAGSGPTWSPFNTGLQLDLSLARITTSGGCGNPAVFGQRLANGFQIFPGSVPLYKGSKFVGALGISGDGTSQDDLIAFFGASRAGLDAAGHQALGDALLGFNAPLELRADLVSGPIANTRLRYVNCPEGPFFESNTQDVCEN